MAQIDTLTLEITSNASKAVQSLDNLSTALGRFKNNMPAKGKFDSLASGFRSLRNELSKLSVSPKTLIQLKSIGSLAGNLAKLNDVKAKNIENTASGLSSLGSALDGISNDNISKIERLTTALNNVPQNANIGQVAKVLQALNTPAAQQAAVSGTSNAGGTVQGIKNAEDSIKKTTSLLSTLSSVSKKIQPVFSFIGKGLGILGGAFKKVISPITHFVKALGRIALYRFIRGVLKSITQGLQEGIQNLALYSKYMEELDAHSANNVMSRYASEFLYFKNAVATAVIPVLRALIPLVETAINRIIDFINVIAQVGSAFFGGTFTKAKYFWVDYADSLDNASGSAKKLHHQLAGFDELNNLTAPSAGGRGSDNLLDPSQMFEESEIDSKIKGFVDKIKKAFENIKKIVKPYTDRLKEMWNKISEKVMPDIKEIWGNLIEEFIKGWLEGFYGEEIEGLPEAIDKITESIKDWTNKLVDLKDKLPINKIKDFANKIGEVKGDLDGLKTPWEWLVAILNPTETGFYNLGVKIGDHLLPKVKDVHEWFNKLKDKLQTVYDKTVNLQEPTSILSEKIESLKEKVKTAYEKFNDLKNKLDEVKGGLSSIKDWLTVFNPFKSGQDNANSFMNVLASIYKILQTLKQIGTITITLAIQTAGTGVLGVINDIVEEAQENNKPDQNDKDKGGQGGGGGNQNLLEQLRKGGTGGHARARGGFVPHGDLFIANEQMPEFIGSIGGNTAVANNNQITEAIAQATYTAMSKALAENGGSVNIVVEGDGDRMFKVFQKKQTEYQRKTGLAY